MMSSPRRCQDVDTVQTLGSVHLRQHLVNHAIRDTGRVVTAIATPQLASVQASHKITVKEKTHRFGAIESNSSKKRMHGFAA